MHITKITSLGASQIKALEHHVLCVCKCYRYVAQVHVCISSPLCEPNHYSLLPYHTEGAKIYKLYTYLASLMQEKHLPADKEVH